MKESRRKGENAENEAGGCPPSARTTPPLWRLYTVRPMTDKGFEGVQHLHRGEVAGEETTGAGL